MTPTPAEIPGARAPGLGGSATKLPDPPSERAGWLVALALGGLGVAVLVAVLSGMVGRTSTAAPRSPPAVLVAAVIPAPGGAQSSSVLAGAETAPAGHGGAKRNRDARHAPILAQPPSAAQSPASRRLVDQTETAIPTRWMEGFYSIYATAQSTFGVSWLLIASIHKQESAFSTAPSTYHGLNFAGCCGGPMQFNVTNGWAGTPSTWALVHDSYRYGTRPAVYDHRTATHPSIYDDFDAIMAAGHLLSADGAEYALNGAAWDAAYAYYGHDAAGVSYADQVIARAIGWSQHGFCSNCGVDPSMIEAVHGAYGAPVLAALEAEAETKARPRPRRKPNAVAVAAGRTR